MRLPRLRSGVPAALAVALSSAACPAGEPTAAQLAFFENEVRPLLAEHCHGCHAAGDDDPAGNLRLDRHAAVLRGGDSGPAVVPGDVDGSLLIEAVRYDGYEMPPEGKLPAADVAVLERWVAAGAPWPEEPDAADGTPRPAFDLEARKAANWSWRPVVDPVVPAVGDGGWCRSPVDRFVLAKLEAAGLRPAPPVDRRTLYRRWSFDLTGLPPAPAAVDRYLADDRPGADGRAVDRLLASPHFGERWGRHWLDLARYAESRGHEFDEDAPGASHYRDYVVRAFNADVPYDRFVREQIAGDLLAEPRPHPTRGFDESVLGTGFWSLGERVHSPVDTAKDEADRFADMIDTASKTFLGLTVACARCHDHKFDAISTADYHALTAFLQSSDERPVRFETRDRNARIAAEIAAVDRAANAELRAMFGRTAVPPASVPTPGRLVADYTDADDRDFLPDGFTFGPRPVRAGESVVARGPDGPVLSVATRGHARRDPAWDRLRTVRAPKTNDRNALTKFDRAGKTLRTSTFELTTGTLAYELSGGCRAVAVVDSHRLIAGPLHGGTIRDLPAPDGDGDAVRWVTHDLADYVGKRIHVEFVARGEEPFSLFRVVDGEPPRGTTLRVVSASHSLREDSRPGGSGHETHHRAARWLRDRERLAREIRTESRTAMAMADGTAEDAFVAVRGDPHRPGERVPRRFLEALDPTPVPADEPGSGRLALADRITDPHNPFTVRVLVNRVWHHLLGRGIVPTVDDFGVLGTPSSHPALLDHLAARFVERGWSVKAVVRDVVLSATYRTSGAADAAAVERDPTNALLHHRPPRRLGGEAVRDALLAVSGELRPVLFGDPVPVHLTPFHGGRGRPAVSGPADGGGRRSLYLAVRRNFRTPLLAAFDVPGPHGTVGRRNVSNVPAQALTLMNDPFVAARATAWAGRATKRSADPAARVRFLYETAFARPPTAAERDAALAFVADHPDPHAAWADLAHALVNVKEFVFVP